MNQGEASPRNYETIDKTQKILSLQEQLLNVRKQMSKKQSQWQKQRSNLLSKNQVANIEIIQLKQRISNLAKINETLSNAMTNQNEINLHQNKSQIKIKRPKPLNLQQNLNIDGLNDSPKDDSDFKKCQKLQQQIKRLNKIIIEKDFQINNLNKMCNELRCKIQQRNSCASSMEQANFNLKKKIQKKQQQILQLHKQLQQVQEKLQQNNQYIDETRRQSQQPQSSKRMNVRQLDENGYQIQSQDYSRKYPNKNSSYLIMKPTSDHSVNGEADNISYYHQLDQNLDDFEPEDQEEQKLLCQVCNRVFTFGQFQEHAQFCGYKGKQKNHHQNTRELFQRKRQIQQRLQKIRLQEQKQNIRCRYYKNSQLLYDVDGAQKSNRDKINQIRQIAQGLSANISANKREYRKNPYSDFSIKNNGRYY